jgi:formylmethanofuran dehydrogenase subunit E
MEINMSTLIQELEKLIFKWKDSLYNDSCQQAKRYCAKELQDVLYKQFPDIYENSDNPVLPKEPKYKIITNKAQCKKCGDIIESLYRHDFQSCKCRAIFVDGGLDYLRSGADNFENFIDLSVTEDVT